MKREMQWGIGPMRAQLLAPLAGAVTGLVLGLCGALLPAGGRAASEQVPVPARAQEAPLPVAPAAGTAHPALWPVAHSRGLRDPATEARIDALLQTMSLEEKIGQMIQGDTSSVKPEDLRAVPLGSILSGGNSLPLDWADGPAPVETWAATARAYRAVALEARPGHTPIPLLFGVDAVHGNSHVRKATVFPHNIGLGAANDPDLIERIGVATAQETAAAGFDWSFGPTVAVPQDLRWGRTYEGYAQRPERVRAYASAVVRGLQGESPGGQAIARGHVAASAKHFLGDGATDAGTDQGNASISEEELIRLHAPGYAAAIDAGVMTVMASFSSWQGVKMSANHFLLTEVLKERMGFEGFVVSDWNSHGQVPGCSNQSCAAAVNAGIDMFMAPDSWRGLYANTLAQVRAGQISTARIDDAVRRILRVKLRMGLFEEPRPLEGQAQVLASPAHRALAREAVRKSLVLLKNHGHLLPLRASAHVLVAGTGADDIGQQCGGWTLSWQGSDKHNADFPQAQSIYAGLRDALTAGGGSAELSADGSFRSRPDVAVVVYGETPYAEGWGDLRNLNFEPGEKHHLALLRHLQEQGIPVVSVFLSGRPLWTNPEINASDAFVAAWLPGSEGGGIADVLVGDAQGHARHDFQGTLSFAWPSTAGHAVQAAQFAYGHGLQYASDGDVGHLPETSGVSDSEGNFSHYLQDGRALAPWSLVLRHGEHSHAVGASGTGGSARADLDGVIAIRAVDAGGLQEGGRELRWSGGGAASVAITGPALDMRMLTNGEAALQISYRVDERPTAAVQLAVGCGPACGAALDVSQALALAPPGQWRTVRIKLSCFRDHGLDVGKIDEPFALTTAGTLRLSITNVLLSSDPAGAVCPEAPVARP